MNFKAKIPVFLLVLGCFLPFFAAAQDWVWSREEAPGGQQFAWDVAADPATNAVYLCGQFQSSVYGLTPYGNPILSDGFISKYDTSGNFLWAFQVGSRSGSDAARSIAVGPGGDLYVTGYYRDSAFFIGTAGSAADTLLSTGSLDIFLARYSPAGHLQWVRSMGGSSGDMGDAITVNSNGVYLTGSFAGTAFFGGLPPITSVGGQDVFLAAYTLNGNPSWAIRGGGTLSDMGTALTSDGSNLYLAAQFTSDSVRFQSTNSSQSPWLYYNGGSSGDIALARISSSGIVGWTQVIGGAGNDFCHDLLIFGGELFASGNGNGPVNFPGTAPTVPSAGPDIFFSKHDISTGNTVFHQFDRNSSPAPWTATSLSGLAPGKILVSGNLSGNFSFQGIPVSNAVGSSSDIFAAQWDVTGSSAVFEGLLTSRSVNLATCEASAGLPSGKTFLTGAFQSGVVLGCDSLPGPNADTDLYLCAIASQALLAVNDSLNLAGGTPVVVQVKTNDSWCRSNPSVQLLTGPTQGIASALNNDSIQYSPNPGFSGLDSLQYSLCDTCSCDTAWVFFKISQNPIAFPDSLCLITGDSLGLGVGSNDQNILPTDTFRLVIAASNGNAQFVSLDSLVYKPGLAFSGLDSALYEVTTQQGSRDSAWVYFFVLPEANAGLDDSICGPGPLLLGANNPGIFSGSWQVLTAGPSLNNASIPNPTVSNLVPGTNLLVWEIQGPSCNTFDTLRLYSSPFPGLTPGTGDTICLGSSSNLDFSLSGNGPFTVYISDDQGGSQQATFPASGPASVSVSPIQSTVYYLDSVVSGSCLSPIGDSIRIEVLPGVDLGPDTSICQGDSIDFNANTGGFYGQANFIWNTGSTDSVITADTAGTYVVEVSVGSCASIDSVNLSLNNAPLVNLGSDTTLCPGDSLLLQANPGNFYPGASYLWSTGSTDSAIKASSAGNFAVELTNAQGCTARDTIGVQFHPLNQVTLPADTVLCAGDTLILDAGSGFSSYNWASGPSTQTLQTTQTGTYSVTVTDGNTCTSSDMISLTFRPLPLVNLGPDTLLCPGDSLQVSADPNGLYPGASYLWSNGPTTNSQTVFAPLTLRVMLTDTFQCSSGDTLVLGVAPVPSIALGPDTKICAGDSILLSGMNPVNVSAYLWNTGDTVQSIQTSSGGIYELVVFSSAGCSDTASQVLNIQVPPYPQLGGDAAFCAGDSVLLFANAPPGSPGLSYLWQDGSTDDSLLTFQAGTYFVAVTDSFGCTATDTVLLSVIQPGSIDLGPDVSICEGDSILLDPDSSGQLSSSAFLWSDGSMQSQLWVDSAANWFVEVSDTGSCGFVYRDTVLVSVNPLPVLDLGTDTTFCAGDSALLTGPPASSYLWSDGSTSQGIWVFSSGIFSLEITGANACRNSDSVQVNAQALPQVQVNLPDSLFCETDAAVAIQGLPAGGSFFGDELAGIFDPGFVGPGGFMLGYTYTDSIGCTATDSLSGWVAALPGPVDAGTDSTLLNPSSQLNALPPVTGSGVWTQPGGQMGTIANPNLPGTQVSDLESGLNTFIWTVSNPGCPAVSDTVRLLVEDFFLPEAISPNGDQLNETFVVGGIERYSKRSFTVFNRWGNQVFSSGNYDNTWAGTSGGGKALPDDTYYFVLDLGEGGKHSGYVVIRRTLP